MAVKQATTRPPMLAFTIALLCFILFVYVIFVQTRHEKIDRVMNPNIAPADQHILGGTRTALPMRRPVPSPLFGSPDQGALPTPTSLLSAPTAINTNPNTILPSVTNPGRFYNQNSLQPNPLSAVTVVKSPMVTSPLLVVPAKTNAPTIAPLNAGSSYTVIEKPPAPGTRPRKATIVNR